MADAKITVSFDQDSRRAIQKFLRQMEELIVRIEALKPAGLIVTERSSDGVLPEEADN